MRPLEALLLIINLAAFLAFAAPRFRLVRFARFLTTAAMLAAGAQVLLEGARWQMAPAYAVSVSLFLISLIPGGGATDGSKRGRLRRLGGRVGTGFGALVLAFCVLPPLAFPVFSLPHPHGPYQVGTLTYDWVDAARREIFTADPRDRRELMVQIWYPARGSKSAKRAPYLADGFALAPLARLLHLPGFVFQQLKYVMTDAMPAAPVAPGAASYPVLVFSHGRGGFRQHNTSQIEELVSHGYVIAAIDHPYAAAGVVFADGRRVSLDARMLNRKSEDSFIPYLAQDVSFTLDQLAAINRSDPNGILTGRLDLQRAGMFGVSLGGEVSAEACRLDPRLRACLIMDVWMPADIVRAGLRQPTMWISRDAATMRLEGWSQAVTDETLGTTRKVFEELPGDGYFVRVPGMFHEDFSDAPFMSPLAPWLGIGGPMDPRRGHAIVSAYELAFFDRHLKGMTTPLLDGQSAHFPEVRFETRRR
jgi:predicted dienelactone hydrolase